MEEIKMNRVKREGDTEKHQIMTALIDNTLRGIIRTANEENIKREDIVSLLKEKDQFILLYYK